MKVPGGDNVRPGRDIVWPELMSEEKETIIYKKRANVTNT